MYLTDWLSTRLKFENIGGWMLISFWCSVSFSLSLSFVAMRVRWWGLLSISLYVCIYVCMYRILQDDTSLDKQISGLLHLDVERAFSSFESVVLYFMSMGSVPVYHSMRNIRLFCLHMQIFSRRSGSPWREESLNAALGTQLRLLTAWMGRLLSRV